MRPCEPGGGRAACGQSSLLIGTHPGYCRRRPVGWVRRSTFVATRARATQRRIEGRALPHADHRRGQATVIRKARSRRPANGTPGTDRSRTSVLRSLSCCHRSNGCGTSTKAGSLNQPASSTVVRDARRPTLVRRSTQTEPRAEQADRPHAGRASAGRTQQPTLMGTELTWADRIEIKFVAGDPVDFLNRDGLAKVERVLAHYLGVQNVSPPRSFQATNRGPTPGRTKDPARGTFLERLDPRPAAPAPGAPTMATTSSTSARTTVCPSGIQRVRKPSVLGGPASPEADTSTAQPAASPLACCGSKGLMSVLHSAQWRPDCPRADRAARTAALICCTADATGVVAESTVTHVLFQGSYSRLTTSAQVGFTRPSTSVARCSTRRRCSAGSEQITSTSTRVAPATDAVPGQASRVTWTGLTHSTMASRPSLSCSIASWCATA